MGEILLHWGLAFLFLSCLIAYGIRRDVPKIYIALFFYLLCISNAVICFRVLSATAVNRYQMNYLLSTTTFSAFTIVIFAYGAYFIKNVNCGKVLDVGIPTFAILASLLSFIFGINLVPHVSSNATMIALGLPYFIPKNKRRLELLKIIPLTISLSCIVFGNASSPIGVSAVVMGSYFLLNGKSRALVFLALIPLLIGGQMYGWEKLLNSTGRFRAWSVFMGYWSHDSIPNVLFGYGVGSFETISQVIQNRTMFDLWIDSEGKLRGQLWMHMHSDWIQFIFEYGVIGFSLVLACFLRLFIDLKDHVVARVTLLGSASAMIFDFPFRYSCIPLVILFLFGLAYRDTVTKQ